MCGIAGFMGHARSAESTAIQVKRMADAIAHRGPDDYGVWTDEDAGIALSHRRLAIVDLSVAGHQPMHSACGRFVMVFNGEIYNHVDLRHKLDAETAHAWRGHSDTETLLAAIVRWGFKKTLEYCVGMFAIALWDRRDRTLTLTRDRVGEKPLYYGRVGNYFAFASELQALRTLPDWRAEISRDSLTLLMRHNYIPAPYSIYSNIYKLRPGHFLLVDSTTGNSRVESYWSARTAVESSQKNLFLGNKEEAVTTLETLLKHSLQGQMMADVPLGAFLSGGVDSSTIVAVMQSMSAKPVRTFTIGFHESGYNEAPYAKKVARHLGTDHTEIYLSEQDAMDVIPRLPNVYSEPFSDSSQIPTFLVSQLARQHVTVSLSGDGGDELFSGYTRYALADSLWGKLSRVPQRVRNLTAGLATAVPPAVYDSIATPLNQLMPMNRQYLRVGDKVHKAAQILSLSGIDEIYRRLCSHWSSPSEIVLGGHEPPTMLTGLEDLPDIQTSVQRMMYTDLLSYLPDDILVKVDRAAMAVSLETRVPLLDHRIIEYSLSLPLSISRAENTTKWPLRQILYKYVPPNIIERPKMGFGIPIDRWLRGGLRDWAEDLLSERRLEHEGYFAPGPIRAAWSEHLSGRRNNQYPLWDVLMFQAWNKAQRNSVL